MREIVWIDSWVDGGICRYKMHAASRKRVFEHREHGEVVAWIEDRVWTEEETGVVGMLGSCAGWKIDFLQACFLGVEELLEDEGIFLYLAGDSASRQCVEKRLWDRS